MNEEIIIFWILISGIVIFVVIGLKILEKLMMDNELSKATIYLAMLLMIIVIILLLYTWGIIYFEFIISQVLTSITITLLIVTILWIIIDFK